MNQRLAAASLVSVFFAIGQAGQDTLGMVGMAATLICQTSIDLSKVMKARRSR